MTWSICSCIAALFEVVKYLYICSNGMIAVLLIFLYSTNSFIQTPMATMPTGRYYICEIVQITSAKTFVNDKCDGVHCIHQQ